MQYGVKFLVAAYEWMAIAESAVVTTVEMGCILLPKSSNAIAKASISSGIPGFCAKVCSGLLCAVASDQSSAVYRPTDRARG
jgi:hypothetical protein